MRGKSTHRSRESGRTARGQDELADSEKPSTAKGKAYRRPVLKSYGRLTDITQALGSQVVDSGSGSLGPAPPL